MQTANANNTTSTSSNNAAELSRADLLKMFKAEKEAGSTEHTTFKTWLEARGTELAPREPVGDVKIDTAGGTQVLSQEQAATGVGQMKQEVTQLQAVIVEGNPPKSKIAEAIFVQQMEHTKATGEPMVRKHILDRFMKEADLSEKGANTYYQNLRKKFDLVGNNNNGTVIIPAAAPVVTEETAAA